MGKTHWVSCVSCGSRFDVARGGYYNPYSRRYTCKKCYKREKAHQKAVNRQIKKQQIADGTYQPNWWERNWKWFMGGLLITTGVGTISSGYIAFLFILVGVAFITWYFLAQKKKRDSVKKDSEKVIAEKWICSKCGAPTTGVTCEYCGTNKTNE